MEIDNLLGLIITLDGSPNILVVDLHGGNVRLTRVSREADVVVAPVLLGNIRDKT